MSGCQFAVTVMMVTLQSLMLFTKMLFVMQFQRLTKHFAEATVAAITSPQQ